MIYPIVIYGDEVLRRHCEPVPADFPDLKQLVADMFLTLEVAYWCFVGKKSLKR